MAESDLYILQQRGNFGLNFLMGLGGVWLQAMVLTAIGVFAGTFLSWPMALLTTIAFYVAGQVAFSFFQDIMHAEPRRRRPVRVADPAPDARQPDV